MGTADKGDLAGLAARECVRSAWRGFNRWRKKYWLTRVIILLLIFAPAIVGFFDPRGPMMARLVRIAIRATEQRYESPLVYDYARFYRAEEAERLRMQLWRDFSPTGPKVLDAAVRARAEAAGLDPEQLTCSLKDADLDQLAAAAKRLGLVPATYSTADVYRRTWDAAQAEVQRQMKPGHERIEALLSKRAELRDYLTLGTWERGAREFVQTLILKFGTPRQVAVWFIPCFFLGGMGSLVLKRRRALLGFFIGAALVFLALRLALWESPYSQRSLSGLIIDGWHFHLREDAYVLLGGAAGYAGGKAFAQVIHRFRGILAGIALLGVVLIAWGVTAPLELHVVRWAWEWSIEVPGGDLVLPGTAAGMVLAAGGLAGLWLLGRRMRRRAVLEKGAESDINEGRERR